MSQQQVISILLRAEAQLTALVEATQRTKELRSSLEHMGKMGGVFAIVNQAVGAFSAGVRSAIASNVTLASSLADMRARLGTSVESYQALAAAARESGAGVEALGSALTHLKRSLAEGLAGQASTLKDFATLGLEARSLSRLTPEEGLAAIARGFTSATDKTAAFGAVMGILGRESAQVIPLLSDVGEVGLKAIEDRVRKTHGLLSADMVEALDAAADRSDAATERMQKGFAGVALSLKSATAAAAEFAADTGILRSLGLGAVLGGPAMLAAGSQAGQAFNLGMQRAIAEGAGLAGQWAVMRSTLGQAFTGLGSSLGTVMGGAIAATAAIVIGDQLAQWIDRESTRWAEEMQRAGAPADAALRALGSGRPGSVQELDERLRAGREELARQRAKLAQLEAEAQRMMPSVAGSVAGGILGNPVHVPAITKAQREELEILKGTIPLIEKRLAVYTDPKLRESLEAQLKVTKEMEELSPFGPGDVYGEEEFRRQSELLAARERAAQQAQMDRQRDYSGSYTGAVSERFSQFQRSSAYDQDAVEGLAAGWHEAIMDIGTAAQQAGAMVRSTVGTAIDSLSHGISGLVLGTETWASALRKIGTSIMDTVIQGFVRMTVAWISQRLQRSAADQAASTAEAAAKAPGALMESITSFGLAAAVGAAAFVAAMALAGGFREGGYTGDGPPDQVAGPVHRGEFVVPAPAVRRIGVERLESITAAREASGTVGAMPRTAAGGGAAESRPVNVYILDDRRAWLAANKDDIGSIAIEAVRRNDRA